MTNCMHRLLSDDASLYLWNEFSVISSELKSSVIIYVLGKTL